MKGVVLVAFVVVAGCGGGSGAPIGTHPLSGKVGGVDFTVAAAETDSFLSTSTSYFANLWDVPVDQACAAGFPAVSTRNIILNIPPKVGSYSLSLGLPATFSYEMPSMPSTYQNDIATSGELDVTELTATTIRGDARFAFGANDSVEGTFEISICPSTN